jgi:hypothetical protein
VIEELRSHVALHHGPHHVPTVVDERAAEGVDCDEKEHQDAVHENPVEHLGSVALQEDLGDESREQGQHERHQRDDNRARHIGREKPAVRFVVG